MIDPAHPAASWYLWILSALFVLAFALPLLLAPLRWARVLRWRIPEDTDLTVYLGRCLGGVALALAVGWVRAALDLEANAVVLEISIAAGALMTAVHAWGALQRRQPPAETGEILMYAALTTVLILIYRSL
jgi:hypothetical protein